MSRASLSRKEEIQALFIWLLLSLTSHVVPNALVLECLWQKEANLLSDKGRPFGESVAFRVELPSLGRFSGHVAELVVLNVHPETKTLGLGLESSPVSSAAPMLWFSESQPSGLKATACQTFKKEAWKGAPTLNGKSLNPG